LLHRQLSLTQFENAKKRFSLTLSCVVELRFITTSVGTTSRRNCYFPTNGFDISQDRLVPHSLVVLSDHLPHMHSAHLFHFNGVNIVLHMTSHLLRHQIRKQILYIALLACICTIRIQTNNKMAIYEQHSEIIYLLKKPMELC